MKKKTLLIVVIIVVFLLMLGFCIKALIGSGKNASPADSSKLSDEEVKEYKDLVKNYAHATDTIFKKKPIEELDIPIAGIDYNPEDIVRAYDEMYDITETNTTGYTEVIKNEEYAATPQTRMLPGPDAWVELGEIITSDFTAEYDDYGKLTESKLYDIISEPSTWVELGDIVVSYTASQLEENDVPFNQSQWSELIIDVLDSTGEESGIDQDFGFLEDEIAEYIDEQWGNLDEEGFIEYLDEYYDDSWDDYREDPVQKNIPKTYSEAVDITDSHTDKYGRIFAEFFPIKYKSTGKLFYRELLNEKQQIAYDIAVSAVQSGQFELDINFGISDAEMDVAMDAVRKDFPEFFYIDGFCTIKDIDGNAVDLRLGIDSDYKSIGMDNALSQITSKVKPAILEAQKLSSDIDKVKYIVDYMSETTSYADLDPMGMGAHGKTVFEMQTIWSGIAEGITVCAGYSSSFQYYMKLLDIPAAYLLSDIHAWNLLELDGDYYYMDVTWVDSRYGISYRWFNFNEDLLKVYAGDDEGTILCHTPLGLSSKLPAARGTKYGYEKWFGAFEVPTPFPTPIVPQKVSTTVLINGNNVSSKINVVEIKKVLYAEGKTFIEAFADSNTNDNKRWFNYEFDAENERIYVKNSLDGELVLEMYFYSDSITRYRNGESYKNMTMNAPLKEYFDVTYIPILGFSEKLGEAGYSNEIVINGETYSYNSESTDSNSSIPSGIPEDEPDSTPDYEPEPTPEVIIPDNPVQSSVETLKLIVDGTEIPLDVNVEIVDDVAYAEGKNYVESIKYPDMSEDSHVMNYEYAPERESFEWVLEQYDFETDTSYVDDELQYLLDYNAILISWWATYETMCVLFLDSTDVIEFEYNNDGDYVPVLTQMSEAPRIINGDVYIPIEAFAKLTDYDIVLE